MNKIISIVQLSVLTILVSCGADYAKLGSRVSNTKTQPGTVSLADFEGIYRAFDEEKMNYAQIQNLGLAIQFQMKLKEEDSKIILTRAVFKDYVEPYKAALAGKGTFFKITSVTEDKTSGASIGNKYGYISEKSERLTESNQNKGFTSIRANAFKFLMQQGPQIA